jgi:PPK2 family polyphosphate:nucleotide phosphotransferase
VADRRIKQLRAFIEPFRVQPGKKVVLSRDFDPSYKADFLDKEEGEQLLQQGIEQLSEFQARLAAQDTYSVLVCLQALDAAGKDGTIRHVMSGVNPQGVEVHGFKVPSAEELDHDYLWRYQKSLPQRGNIGIFNRSHYEEVLVVRVHEAILANEKLPKAARTAGIWGRRYRAINDWERHLVENGYKVVKLFLNLSNEEQRRRFLSRIDEPDKNWKFSAGDARERQYWDAYQKAFSEMLSATSTEWAPWYVVPADHKWFARIAAGAVIIETLMTIDPQYPVLAPEALAELQQVKKELEAEAPDGVAADPVEEELKKKAARGADGRDDPADDEDDPPAKHKKGKKDKKGGKKGKK